VMKTYATERNPDLKRVQEELNGLREQRRKLEASESSYFSYSNTIIPAGQVPFLSIEYLRIQRELKYQQALYDVLLKQYEVARLDEVKDSSTIRVVTAALPPEKVYKPKLLLVPVLAGGSGLFVAIFLAFVLEVAHRLSQNPRNKARIDDLRSHLKRL
jgi:tyrosine-protein kinase Etk/Wzc